MVDEWGRLPGSVRRAVRADIGATLPAPCAICGLTVDPDTAWEVEHRIPVRDRPDLVLERSNLGPSHRGCNRGKGPRTLSVASWSWPA